MIVGKSISEILAERKQKSAENLQQSQQALNRVRNLFEQGQEDYVSGRRNPIAAFIRQPEKDIEKENRLKNAAKYSVLSEALGLLGKGYAASKGVMPRQTEGKGVFNALGELERLNDIYKQEGIRYDQTMYNDVLRRQKASDDLGRFRLLNAQQDFNTQRQQAQADEAAMLKLMAGKEGFAQQKELAAYKDALAQKARNDKFNQDKQLIAYRSALNNKKTGSISGGGSRNAQNSLYTIPVYGRQIPVTREMEQELSRYGVDKKLIPDDFKWESTKSNPQLQNTLGAIAEQMKIRRVEDSAPNSVYINGATQFMIPALYKAQTAKEAEQIINSMLNYLPDDKAREDFIKLNKEILEELSY